MDIFFGCFSTRDYSFQEKCVAIFHKWNEVDIFIPADVQYFLMPVLFLVWVIDDIHESAVVYSCNDHLERYTSLLSKLSIFIIIPFKQGIFHRIYCIYITG